MHVPIAEHAALDALLQQAFDALGNKNILPSEKMISLKN